MGGVGCGWTNGGYIAYDPQEDTETNVPLSNPSRSMCYIAYDPQEDTETPITSISTATIPTSYIAYDPQEDTETVHGRLLARRGGCYIAYDPQEDTETELTPNWYAMHGGLHRLRSARGY